MIGAHMAETERFPRPRRRKGSGAVTLRDVAQLAGVAPITASRALNTPSQVSPEVLGRVTEAVRQTGYVPNLLAGALSSMKSRMVGVAVPTIAGPVFLDTVQSLTEALFEAGYQVLLGQTGYDNAREDAWLEAMIGRRPDGLVLTGTSHSEQARTRLRAAGVPVVETWDQSDDPIDMLVGFSHVEVGRKVAAYLHERGYRRLAGVAGSDERAMRRFRASHASRCRSFRRGDRIGQGRRGGQGRQGRRGGQGRKACGAARGDGAPQAKHADRGRTPGVNKACARGYASLRTSESEGEHRRQFAAGVPAFAKATARSRRSSKSVGGGPQRHCLKSARALASPTTS